MAVEEGEESVLTGWDLFRVDGRKEGTDGRESVTYAQSDELMGLGLVSCPRELRI